MEQINKKIIYTGTIPQCPYCEKPTQRTEGMSMVTALYHAPVYDCNGLNINPAKNECSTEWVCLECKNNYVTRGDIYTKPTFDKPTAEERLLRILDACNGQVYIAYPDYTDYQVGSKFIFRMDTKKKEFVCDEDNLWDIFDKEYQMNQNEIKDFISHYLNKKFKWIRDDYDYTVRRKIFKANI